MELFNRKLFMSDNKDNKQNQRNSKGGGPNKPDDNFDWSKILRMVFGWGAVVVAAVILIDCLYCPGG